MLLNLFWGAYLPLNVTTGKSDENVKIPAHNCVLIPVKIKSTFRALLITLSDWDGVLYLEFHKLSAHSTYTESRILMKSCLRCVLLIFMTFRTVFWWCLLCILMACNLQRVTSTNPVLIVDIIDLHWTLLVDDRFTHFDFSFPLVIQIWEVILANFIELFLPMINLLALGDLGGILNK